MSRYARFAARRDVTCGQPACPARSPAPLPVPRQRHRPPDNASRPCLGRDPPEETGTGKNGVASIRSALSTSRFIPTVALLLRAGVEDPPATAALWKITGGHPGTWGGVTTVMRRVGKKVLWWNEKTSRRNEGSCIPSGHAAGAGGRSVEDGRRAVRMARS